MAPLIGVFDLFRIGLGPSSSHTVGPMRAARAFVEGARPVLARANRVEVTLLGSLAWTGGGHGTDVAVIAGLSGLAPDTADPDAVHALPAAVAASGRLLLDGDVPVGFVAARDIIFDRTTATTVHPNTLILRLFADAQPIAAETWYSVGGGFIERDGAAATQASASALPHGFADAAEMLALCARHGCSIAELQFANECALRPPAAVRAHIVAVAAAMDGCIDRGLAQSGMLPGGLKVRRRAAVLAARIEEKRRHNRGAATEAMDLASLWAIAVNEENAAGGRVVTAPTNGAAGVIPAVLRHWRRYHPDAAPEGLDAFLLTAAAVGALAKTNASISGAEVGCQGEVGVACAMAAAGLAAALGGTAMQVENAAEIGLEHHLGMTCDPIGGLVQIPCIERNAFGAIKAINAASLALAGDGTHRVSLDQVIATMRQTGLDMHSKYKETSQGGLAVHVTAC